MDKFEFVKGKNTTNIEVGDIILTRFDEPRLVAKDFGGEILILGFDGTRYGRYDSIQEFNIQNNKSCTYTKVIKNYKIQEI